MASILWELTDESHVIEVGERNQAVEVWYTRNLGDGPTGLRNPKDTHSLMDTCPPQYGQPHTDARLIGAIVRRKRLIYGPVKNAAKVMVWYDSAVRFNFGQYLARGATGKTVMDEHFIPVVDGQTLMVHWTRCGYRAITYRTVTVFSSAFNTDSVQSAISENAGSLYFFPTDRIPASPPFSVESDVNQQTTMPFLLVGGYCVDLGNGLKKAVYEFKSSGRVPIIDKTQYGGKDNIPKLDYLEEYAVDISVAPGVVGRITPLAIKRYDVGKMLPSGNWFIPLP